MKTIFLDIDGVLNRTGTKERCGHFLGVDRAISTRFLKAIQGKDVEIVLSSTWRLHPEMHPHLREAGIEWVNVTPSMGSRGVEIEAYIQDWGIQDYIILDDMDCLPKHKPFHIQPEDGLRDEHFERLNELLV